MPSARITDFPTPLTIGARGYRLSNMGHGSERYGACEVCQQTCETTFLQTEAICYKLVKGQPSWTYHGAATSLFGHRSCLLSRRRTPQPATA